MNATRVPVVEDEAKVRDIVVRTLGREGFRVFEANGAPMALEVFAEHGEQIDMLLTDVVMPGMGGRMLAERLREISPGLPVLFMTGYTDDEILHHGVQSAEVPLIEKPFTPSALVARVREVLDDIARAA